MFRTIFWSKIIVSAGLKPYSKTLNNRTEALITSTGVVLVVLVLVFVVPGVDLVVVDVVASHYVY